MPAVITPKDAEWKDLKVHPLAHVSLPMTDGEYAELKADIATNRLRVPIILWRDKKDVVWIIDGVHRHRICIELGAGCPATFWIGEESGIKAYAESLNDKRRHYSPERKAQAALAAAKIANIPQGGDRSKSSTELLKISDAAAQKGASVADTKRAAAVIKRGVPELEQEVAAGKIALTKAAEIARTPKAEQPAAIEAAKETKPAKKPPKQKPETVPKADYDKLVEGYNALQEKCDFIEFSLKSHVDVANGEHADQLRNLMIENRAVRKARDESMVKVVELERQVKWWRKQAESLGWKPKK
jgi:ParB-like chromosome segregation protein Spo0J